MTAMNFAITIGFVSIAIGFLFFKVLLTLIPKLETRESKAQRNEVLKEAKKQREAIIKDSIEQEKASRSLDLEELDEEIKQSKNDLKEIENDLNNQQSFIETEEKRLTKTENQIEIKSKYIGELQGQIKTLSESIEKNVQKKIEKLEKLSEIDALQVKKTIEANHVENRQLECQKVIKSLTEELSSSSQKRAQRILDRTLARYQPQFVWPKSQNVVEIEDKKIATLIKEESFPVLEQLAEISGANVSFIPPASPDSPSVVVKFAGGFGISRESARLTLTELINKGPRQWNQAGSIYQKHHKTMENQANELGQKAVNILKLPNIHPEIQKLVGALNWRTSYRQNQWFHTVEVALLAGVLANELGVDPEEAKRVGMLHDIGKALDYRIEGSHAVISGDYADRFGENRLICDTVMSHHADLIVESPLAYVLRAADTLSGARPGARVNLEEGYQIRLSAIYEAVQSFTGVNDIAIMNGGREVHVQVNHKKVAENQIENLTSAIARKIEEKVAFPGQIKVVVSRPFEVVTVA